MSTLGVTFGFDHRMAPGQFEEGYTLRAAFAGNTLTNDPAVWKALGDQLRAQPDLALGGISALAQQIPQRDAQTQQTPLAGYALSDVSGHKRSDRGPATHP